MVGSCQNTGQPKSESVIESKQTIISNASDIDTPKVSNQSTVSSVVNDTPKVLNQSKSLGTVGTDKGMKKDTTRKTGTPRAIIHKAPEQEKIDSIKNAKQKLKK